MSKKTTKVSDNGRKSYPELKESFEKVIVKHQHFNGGTARTTAILVQDGIVHVGVSKYSNRTFQFSKSKGQNAALGRAEHSANVFHGVEKARVSKDKRREELSFSIVATEGNSVDDIIISLIGTKKS